jgi:hypothetical protein
MRLTALPPPPPTPITLMRAPMLMSSSSFSLSRVSSSASLPSGTFGKSDIRVSFVTQVLGPRIGQASPACW